MQVVLVELQEVKARTILLNYDIFLPRGSIAWPGTTTIAEISPQRGIESDDPELFTKSRSITSGQTTEDVRKIYDFVSTWLKWPHGNSTGIQS